MYRMVCPFTPQLSLVLINRPRRDGTLSWRCYTAAVGGIRTRASLAPYHSATIVTRKFGMVTYHDQLDQRGGFDAKNPNFEAYHVPTQKLLNIEPQNLSQRQTMNTHGPPNPLLQRGRGCHSPKFFTHTISIFQLLGRVMQYLSG